MPTLDRIETPAEPSGERYQPIAQIGRGGMAEVLLAMMDAGCGARRLVVLKRIWPELATDPEFMTMFMDEARLSVRLNHPNVVRTFEVLSTQTEVSIAMEYLDGQPLIRVLNRLRGSGELSVPLRLRIVMSVLAGVEHAHTLTDLDGAPLEVVHRDVSPQNVFVTYDGQVKLVDFGVAKTLAASHHTRPGALKGKLAYMAPEQLQPVPTDRRADLFAVGILLWEMLSGKRMWQGMNEVQIVSQLAAGLPFPALPSDIGLPAGLDAICERALQPNPDHRYQTAAEMEMDLDRVSIGAADSHARNLGRVVSLAFAAERAERQVLIESSRHGVVTGELPLVAPAQEVERPATPSRAMPSIDVTVSDLGLERPAAGDPSPVFVPPSARGRRLWLRRTAAFAGVLVIGLVLVRVDGGAKRLLVEGQPAPVAQPAPAPASSAPPIPATAPQPAAVVIADEALARDQPRSRRVHHRPSADEDATLPPTPAIAGVDLDDPPDRFGAPSRLGAQPLSGTGGIVGGVLAAAWGRAYVLAKGRSAMSSKDIGTKYVAMCREGKQEEVISELFSPDAVSVEASAPPGMDRTVKGIEGIRGKSKWWASNHTVHNAELFGPYPHDDRFAVRFVYDITNKPSNKRFTMDEVGLFTVANGKIVKEEFFYTGG